jgi:phenylpropionate dioxygenase-like ring-hydroxylating dioxygenase large terminal subunit
MRWRTSINDSFPKPGAAFAIILAGVLTGAKTMGQPRVCTRGWVDAERGVVSREVFVSDDVYRQELTHIFEKGWVFLAHETEIPAPGDYVVRTLANAPVIVIRDADGSVRAMLNSCRHRGAKLCRADAGNARRFVCPYHGWSYERDGRLTTTGFDAHMPHDMDFSQWGLIRVPHVESYRGLVFGSWNCDVVDLATYLGDFRWYIDCFLGRTPGGMQVLAPPHRWRAKANWKVGALNFIGDSQHVFTTHIGPVTLNPLRSARSGFTKAADRSVQVITEGGHGCTLSYLAQGMSEDAYRTHDAGLMSAYSTMLKPDQMKVLHQLRVAVGTIFPNLSFIETTSGVGEKSVIIRLWHPVSGSEMEILSWVLAEKEASEAYKASALNSGVHNFGIAGVFEQDDLELWASATHAADNAIARQYPYSFHTSLPLLERPLTDYEGPGRAFRPTLAEVIQFEFMRHWDRVMMAN